MPRQLPIGPRPLIFADLALKYWKVQLSARELLGSTGGWSRAALLLSTHPQAQTLEVLCRANLVLAAAAYPEVMDAQGYLATQFHSQEVLNKADNWIRRNRPDGEAYLFGEQQLLVASSLVVLNHRRRTTTPLPKDKPYVLVGEALLHIASDLDPLEKEDPQRAAEAPPDQRARFAELVLRKGFFYAQDDHRYAIGRYFEMLSEIAPTLTADPDFIDLPALFKQATGIKLATYLAMGIAIMAPFRQLNRTNAHATRAAISESGLFSKSNLRRGAKRFFALISCNKRRFASS